MMMIEGFCIFLLLCESVAFVPEQGFIKLNDDVPENPRLKNSRRLLRDDSHEKKQNVVLIPVCICMAIIIVILVMVIIFIARRNRDKLKTDMSSRRASEDEGDNRISLEIRKTFTFNEVLEMTNNFERVIGSGGVGRVYYGRLGDDSEVAVKLMTESQMTHARQAFTSEVKQLTRIQHRYVVSFVGFCDEGENMICIYEYMDKGDLKAMLSGKSDLEESFNLEKRIKTALNVAVGLEYLHEGCRPPIIHGNVKTRNILLNDKLEAKLAGFGLSKQLPSEWDMPISTCVAGTPGYIDPEYVNTSMLSTKSDVYSYGVVLLELITGHPAFIEDGNERVHIVQWVRSNIATGDIASIADPRLQGQYDITSMQKVADVALACTSEESVARPTMIDIVRELKAALDVETHRVRTGTSTPTTSSDHIEYSMD